jgi:hypothetical protein
MTLKVLMRHIKSALLVDALIINFINGGNIIKTKKTKEINYKTSKVSKKKSVRSDGRAEPFSSASTCDPTQRLRGNPYNS